LDPLAHWPHRPCLFLVRLDGRTRFHRCHTRQTSDSLGCPQQAHWLQEWLPSSGLGVLMENVVCHVHILDGTIFWQARHFHAKVLAISSVEYSMMHPATARRCVLTCTMSCQAVE
jgi:hypothetical protein